MASPRTPQPLITLVSATLFLRKHAALTEKEENAVLLMITSLYVLASPDQFRRPLVVKAPHKVDMAAVDLAARYQTTVDVLCSILALLALPTLIPMPWLRYGGKIFHAAYCEAHAPPEQAAMLKYINADAKTAKLHGDLRSAFASAAELM